MAVLSSPRRANAAGDIEDMVSILSGPKVEKETKTLHSYEKSFMPPSDFDFEAQQSSYVPRRRRRSNRTLILLAAGGLSLFVCCGGCVVFLRPWELPGTTTYPNRVTEVNYHRITVGMTLKEVEEVLGPTTKGADVTRSTVPVGNVLWEDGIEIHQTLEKNQNKASFYLWDNYPTRILIGFDKMPPGADATVNSKVYFVRQPNKVICLSQNGSKGHYTEHEVRLP
jgi:hypothetical protein